MWGGYVYSGFSDETVQGRRFQVRSSVECLGTHRCFASSNAHSPCFRVDRPRTPHLGRGADRRSFDHSSMTALPTTRPTNTWRGTPQCPYQRELRLSVWTGKELIVWGTAIRARAADIFEGPQRTEPRTIPSRIVENDVRCACGNDRCDSRVDRPRDDHLRSCPARQLPIPLEDSRRRRVRSSYRYLEKLPRVQPFPQRFHGRLERSRDDRVGLPTTTPPRTTHEATVGEACLLCL